MRPLLRAYPELADAVPHRPLADLPTPVESSALADNAWIKRDDLTHPVYGGNKIRKLEFIIADALARQKNHIHTFGATGTNHGVATALMAREAGLDRTIMLFDQPVSDTVRGNLRLMQALGARLEYRGSLPRTLARFYLHPRRLDPRSYFLFAGGSSVLGTLGFVNAALELAEQIEAGDMPCPARIICPTGSGATLAGLTLGMHLAGLPVRVEGVRVAPSHLGPFAACTTGTLRSLVNTTTRFLNKHLNPPVRELPHPVLRDEYFGEGYGEATAEGEKAREKLGRQGLKLEPTYTGKAAAAFLDRLDETQGPVLFWHTYNSRDTGALAERADPAQLPAPLRALLDSPPGR